MTVTEQDIRCATTALGRAEIFDDRVTADRARIAAWAEALTPFAFDPPDVIAAVTAHYQRAGADTIRPGDVIAAARKIRSERAEREKGAAASALPTPVVPPDRQLGGLPIANVDGEPIWNAYEAHGAIERPCPTCDAPPEEACTNTQTGTVRRIPCTTRLTDGNRK